MYIFGNLGHFLSISNISLKVSLKRRKLSLEPFRTKNSSHPALISFASPGENSESFFLNQVGKFGKFSTDFSMNIKEIFIIPAAADKNY